MPLQPVYLVSVGNLPKFLEAIRHAQTPEKMNLKFIEELGFKSTNDRLFLPFLKAMRFLDDAGKPTAKYHEFLDDTQWKRVLADGIRNAYPDLFRINRNAQTFTREQLSGKLRSLGEGKISDAVLKNMVRTFAELVKLADFSAESDSAKKEFAEAKEKDEDRQEEREEEAEGERAREALGLLSGTGLVYRIEIVLPAVRDQAVYDAIFRSAKKHLLR
jgi:hypothetical protein